MYKDVIRLRHHIVDILKTSDNYDFNDLYNSKSEANKYIGNELNSSDGVINLIDDMIFEIESMAKNKNLQDHNENQKFFHIVNIILLLNQVLHKNKEKEKNDDNEISI